MRGRIKADACRNNFGRAVIVVMLLFMGNMGRAMPAVGGGGGSGSGCKSACQDNNTCVSADELKLKNAEFDLAASKELTCINKSGKSKCKKEIEMRKVKERDLNDMKQRRGQERWVCQ